MKKLLLTLEDSEWEYLNRLKGNRTWKEFLLAPYKNEVMVIQEISNEFDRLRRRLVELTKIEDYALLAEYMRVICIKIAKSNENERKVKIEKALNVLANLIKEL